MGTPPPGTSSRSTSRLSRALRPTRTTGRSTTCYNVGYHNEHHDFPFVPWSRLPEITRIASEFYDPLPKCNSWCGIIWTYITDPRIGAYSRVKRNKVVNSSEKVNPNDVTGDTYSTTETISTKSE